MRNKSILNMKKKQQKSKNEKGSSLKKDGSKSFFKAKCDFYWATGQ